MYYFHSLNTLSASFITATKTGILTYAWELLVHLWTLNKFDQKVGTPPSLSDEKSVLIDDSQFKYLVVLLEADIEIFPFFYHPQFTVIKFFTFTLFTVSSIDFLTTLSFPID